MAASRGWVRLAEFTRERRVELGLTQEDVRAAGGPSTATMRLIEGALQERYQLSTLRDLERALRWGRGSAASILDGGEPAAMDVAPLPAAASRGDTPSELPVSPAMRAAMQDLLDEVKIAVRQARRVHGNAPLTGEMVFPPPRWTKDDRDLWDMFAATGWRQEVIEQSVAAARIVTEQRAARGRRNGHAVGLLAASARSVRRSG